MPSLRLLSTRRAIAHAHPSPRPRLATIRHSSSASQSVPPSSSSSALRTGIYATVFAISTGIFAVYYLDSRSAIHRYFFTPLLRYALDPETGHKFAVKVLRSGLAPRDTQVDDEILRVELWDEELSNPVGLAAGFDKDGEAIDGLFNLGFSWVEIGSVTPKPQPGNPKPRVFHLPADSALINRYGFPSEGHISVLNRLKERTPLFQTEEEKAQEPKSFKEEKLLAVNLGKNKSSPPDEIADFVKGVKTFAPYADVLVVNVSSPNTPGLRGLQSRTLLEELLKGVIAARDEVISSEQASSHRKPKLVLKIAPDLSESNIIDIAEVVRAGDVDGVIVSNTTIERPAGLIDPNKIEAGGLSGTPLKPLALSTLRTLRAHIPPSIPLIGCGGISTGKDALDYARAGASFIQMYTSFGYEGVGAVRRIKDELTEELKKEGKSWMEVVRGSVAELSLKEKKAEVELGKVGGEGVGEEKSVKVLIEEAEELKNMLDRLSEGLEVGESTGGVKEDEAIVASVPTV